MKRGVDDLEGHPSSRQPVLLLLREGAARGQKADCRPHRLHLRRMHQVVQRHPRRGRQAPETGTTNAELVARGEVDLVLVADGDTTRKGTAVGQYFASSSAICRWIAAASLASTTAVRNDGVLKRREIRASAFKWMPAEFSGAKSTKKREVGFPSMAWKSMP